jgi:hypothetical protein
MEASLNTQGLLDIADIVGAQRMDSTGTAFLLSCQKPCLMWVPWAEPSSSLHLCSIKANTPISVFLDKEPGEMNLNGVLIAMERGQAMTHNMLNVLLEDRIDFFLNQLRVLKVMNSMAANKELGRIVTYFTELEELLPPPDDLNPFLVDGPLSGWTQYMSREGFASTLYQVNLLCNEDNSK